MEFQLWENTCYLLALLNPASKVMFLAAYQPKLSPRQNWELAWKSTLAAWVILFIVAGTGQFLLSRVFRVELCALQITGGLVVFVIGWTAVNQGHFLKRQQDRLRISFTEVSLVPLAAPLIAGPGMIAAVIAGAVSSGFLPILTALTAALAVNFVLMVFANGINCFLTRCHLLGPLIRLTGLVIAAVSIQMIISGIRGARLLN